MGLGALGKRLPQAVEPDFAYRAAGCESLAPDIRLLADKKGSRRHRLSVDLRLEDEQSSRIEFMKNDRGSADGEPSGLIEPALPSGWPVPDDCQTIAVAGPRAGDLREATSNTQRPRPDDFRRHLFGPRPAAEAALAEVDGEAVGFALWFSTFSTFRGQPGLYLEDIFVKPEYRGRGIGKARWRPWRPGRRARLRAAGVVGAELERSRRRLLPLARGAAAGRVDGLPDRRRAAPATGGDGTERADDVRMEPKR